MEQPGERMRWYLEAKFGLFLHWGPYAAAGVEASWPIMAPDMSEAMFRNAKKITEAEYVGLPDRFDPADFRPDEWVRAARAAGMRYIVVTAKHHDGFCMFDAPGTAYKITNTPFGRDVCLELAKACCGAGMRLGFYYSPPDMHHPGYRDTGRPAASNWLGEPGRAEWAGYLDYMESHVRKLLTDYGEVSVLWFDGLVNHAKYDPPRFHRLVRELSPLTLINDRLGDGYDFITPEQFIPRDGIPVRSGRPPSGNAPGGDGFVRAVLLLLKTPGAGAFIRGRLGRYSAGALELTHVPQARFPSPQRFQPWETCMTLGRSWAYNPGETEWKAPGTVVRHLVDVVGHGGNYLLDVGPTDRGRFPDEALERLAYVGRWMERNGESIHGTRYTPVDAGPWGQATRRGDRLYLHVLDWPSDGRLVVRSVPGTVRGVAVLAGGPLPFTKEGTDLRIDLPRRPPDPDASVLVADIDGADPAWSVGSPKASEALVPKGFLRSQAAAAGLVNLVLNGALALATYLPRAHVAFDEAAVDALITTAIIGFLVAWIEIASIRGKLPLGRRFLSGSSAVTALFPTAVCTVLFGGLVVCGALYLTAPGGMPGWTYAAVKALYAGGAAVAAAVLGVLAGSARPWTRGGRP